MFGNLINYFSPNEGRIEYFDIAKGFLIILVVWFHARGPFCNYISQFFMPMFFLISGLLYSQRSGVKEYVIRKVHSLYLPFVIWNLVFLVIMATYKNYKFQFFLKKTILILLTLDKMGVFLGATWFLGALFLIAVLYKILESSFKESSYKDISLLVIFTIIAIIGFKFNLPYALSRVLILGFFYAIGAFIKRNRTTISDKISKIPIHSLLPILGGIIFIIIASFNRVHLSITTEITYPLLFVVGALGASYFIITLCKWVENTNNKLISSIKKVFIVAGQHSIDILIWHFVFFYGVIILQFIFYNEKITLHKIFLNHTYITTSGWWIVYLLVGVVASLIWGYILRQGIWGKFLKKIHAVD